MATFPRISYILKDYGRKMIILIYNDLKRSSHGTVPYVRG